MVQFNKLMAYLNFERETQVVDNNLPMTNMASKKIFCKSQVIDSEATNYITCENKTFD